MKLDEQFSRLIEMLRLIDDQPYKWDVERFELKFGVAHATVERDLRILRKWATVRRKNGYLALEDCKFLPVSLKPSEMLALAMAAGILNDNIGAPFSKALKGSLRKVTTHLPKDMAASVAKMNDRVSIGINLVRSCNSELLDKINSAINYHHPLNIKYFVPNRNELTERKINPYGLTLRFGAWYLIAWCNLRNEIRTFAVDRIRDLIVAKEHFIYPNDFDLNEYLSRGWSLQANADPVDIVLKFNKDTSQFIKGCKYHPNQIVIEQPDGSVIFKVTVAGIDEIKHWILGFGSGVEVIEPVELRNAIIKTCRQMAELYKV